MSHESLNSFGQKLSDGGIQLSFILPVPATEEAKETACAYVKKMGIEKASVLSMEKVTEQLTSFVLYGYCHHLVEVKGDGKKEKPSAKKRSLLSWIGKKE
ncbi:MAG: OAM dimerization domain-containing protein [bacterium]|nr:OAM dimerization domain-containing protein [bacterium]